MKAYPLVKVIFPSGPVSTEILEKSLQSLAEAQISYEMDYPEPHPDLNFLASSKEHRLKELIQALQGPYTHILCARGGYGMSDLLSSLDWKFLKTLKPKSIVGFSDISSLHSAVYTQLQWPCIHGPMPGSGLWGKHGSSDVEKLLEMLLSPQEQWKGSLRVQPLFAETPTQTLHGQLFGGCMSVLCNLLGTPLFPKTLKGCFLLLEDTNEPPGRLMRMLNQILMSGLMKEASGLIFGNFGTDIDLTNLFSEILQKSSIPCFVSEDFGHISPNIPWVLGAKASLKGNILSWHYGAS